MAQFQVKYEFRFDPSSKKKSDNNIENFYSHHRMKIYDNTVVEEWEEKEDSKKYSFDISEELLEKYKGQEEIFRYLKRLADNKRIYSVTIQPNRSLRFRNDEIGKFFKKKKQEYKKIYDNQLAERYAKADVYEEYLTESGRKKHGRIIPQYSYYITIFSKGLSGLLQQLFVSTLVYAECGTKWPENLEKEWFEFQFDTEKKKATLIDINIFNPEDPFNRYIRKSMRVTGKIGNTEKKNEDVIDYYLEDKITPWHKYDTEEFKSRMKTEDNSVGIYMLYDSVNSYFYVGKAEQIYKRMQEHKDSEERIKHFDFYRYSLIDPFHYDDIFLIENAAIHDCAMLLCMDKNKDYSEKALAVLLPDGKNMKDITMINTVKKQSKRPRK